MKKLIFFLLLCNISLFAKEVIVFDFGGVIGKVNRASVIAHIAASLDLPYKIVKTEMKNDHLYIALEDKDFWPVFAKRYGRKLPAGWEESLEEQKAKIVTLVPGMQDLVAELKEKGYRLALLSNTKSNRADFLRKRGHYDPFDPVLVSCEMGTKKPLPRAYEILLEKVDVPASEIIFIDNKMTNIHAGEKFGIRGIHFKNSEQVKKDLYQSIGN